MTKLFYFTKTQERRRNEVFLSWNGGDGGFISNGGENINGRSFNEG